MTGNDMLYKVIFEIVRTGINKSVGKVYEVRAE
jgi:hypothetical protein